MATLEIHDDTGQIQFVSISRLLPALIGSGSHCDVVLAGPDIQDTHARIRWRRGRFKIQCLPHATPLSVNGRKMVSSSLREEDELRLGVYRIFMLSAEDGPPPPAPDRSAAVQRVEQAHLDILEDLFSEPSDDAIPSATSTPIREPAARPSFARRSPRVASGPRGSILSRVGRFLVGAEETPGQERVITSPLVIGLVAALTLLGVLSWFLWDTILDQIADNRYARAVAAMTDGDYPEAIRNFDRFLAGSPRDQRVPSARVQRDLARVRRLASGASPPWSEAARAAVTMFSTHRDDPAFDDHRMDLGQVMIAIAEGLAQRATAAEDAATLALAEDLLETHQQLAGEAATAQRNRSRLATLLPGARQAVRRGVARRDTLAAMDQAIAAGNAAQAYEIRDALIRDFPELATESPLLERLARANDLLRDAVRSATLNRPASTAPRPDPLGPPTTLVERHQTPDTSDQGRAPGQVFALTGGMAYGIDATNGAPVWQRPVGLSSPYPPRSIGGQQPAVLVVDARAWELLLLDAGSGALIWRQPLGEVVTAAPLVLGSDLYQVLPSGKLWRIDLASGELKNQVDLGRRLAAAPASDELGGHLYVTAEDAVLFVLDRATLGCTSVAYLGHQPGSIIVPPVRLAGLLLISENHEWDRAQWRILRLEKEGASLAELQRVALPGWIWSAPVALGSVAWAAGDSGGLAAFAVGSERDPDPLRAIARQAEQPRPTGPAFGLARTEREYWYASGSQVGRVTLAPERGSLAIDWSLAGQGPARAPLQQEGPIVVPTTAIATQHGIELWGLDATSPRVRWRTRLGVPWPAPPVAGQDAFSLETLNADGQLRIVPLAALRQGGFIQHSFDPNTIETLAPSRWLGPRLLQSADQLDHLRRVQTDAPPTTVPLPSPMAAAPLVEPDRWIVPGADGLVYLLDPQRGQPLADPFVPSFDRQRPRHWFTPIPLGVDRWLLADRGGRLQRVMLGTEPRARLVADGPELDLGGPLASPPVAQGQSLIAVMAEGRVRSLSLRDDTPIAAWPLDAPLAYGPTPAGDWVLIVLANGQIQAVARDGQRAWSAQLDEPACQPPALLDQHAWFLGLSGVLRGIDLRDGQLRDRLPLDWSAFGGPLAIGDQVAIPLAPGSVALCQPASAPSDEATTSPGDTR